MNQNDPPMFCTIFLCEEFHIVHQPNHFFSKIFVFDMWDILEDIKNPLLLSSASGLDIWKQKHLYGVLPNTSACHFSVPSVQILALSFIDNYNIHRINRTKEKT